MLLIKNKNLNLPNISSSRNNKITVAEPKQNPITKQYIEQSKVIRWWENNKIRGIGTNFR